jgi:hypothetical protein
MDATKRPKRSHSRVTYRPFAETLDRRSLVVADPIDQIAHLRDEAHLLNRRCGRAGLWKHVADFGDFTLWLLPRGVEF